MPVAVCRRSGYNRTMRPPPGPFYIADLTAVSLLASGVSQVSDTLTLETFQKHLLRELHDTGFEPAFGLVGLTERPLSATFNVKSPDAHVDRLVAALADRCFAASYFRFQGLA